MPTTKLASPRASRTVSPHKASPARRSPRTKHRQSKSPNDSKSKSPEKEKDPSDKNKSPVLDGTNIRKHLRKLSEEDLESMQASDLKIIVTAWNDQYEENPYDAEEMNRLQMQLIVEKWIGEIKNSDKIIKENMWESKSEKEDKMRLERMSFGVIHHQDELNKLNKQDLVTYLYYNSHGSISETEHETLYEKDESRLRDYVMQASKVMQEGQQNAPNIEDTLHYLKVTSFDDDLTNDLSVLQYHVGNWITYSEMVYSGVMPHEDVRDLLAGTLDLGREEPHKPNHVSTFHMDEIGGKSQPMEIDLDSKIENKMDNITASQSNEDILNDSSIVLISEKVTDFQIQQMDQVNMSKIYRKYLLENSINHEATSISNMDLQQLRDAITSVRDTQLKQSRQLNSILEHKGQESIELLQSVPDIVPGMKDKEIDNMSSSLLAKVLYKHNAKKGKPQSISTYFVWRDETLIKAIKKQRDLKKSSTKKQSILKAGGTSISSTSKQASKQSNLNGQLFNSWRYSFTFELADGSSGTAAMREYLIQIFQEMRTMAEGACLLPWATLDNKDSLQCEEDFPETISQLRKYFKDIRPTDNGPIWTKIRLGLPISADRQTFQVDFSAWGSNQKIRLYECPVQHPNFRTCGWLAYMPRSVNPKAWSTTVQRMYEETYNTPGASITLGLSWRALNGQRDVERSNKVYAMHVETPVGQASLVKKFLRILARKKIWPLGVRYRLFAEHHQYMKELNKRRYRYLLDRHKTLIKQLKEFSTSTILELDKKIPNTKVTLREAVIDIRDIIDNRRVFASIDEKYQSMSDFVATFRPDKTSKAKEFIESLPTYIKHLYPHADLSGIFTIDAIEAADFEEYNPENQQFTTQEDNDLKDEVEFDRDDESFEFLNEKMDPEILAQLDIEFDSSALHRDDSKIRGGSRLFDFSGEQDTVTTGASIGNTSQVSFQGAYRHMFDKDACTSSITASSTSSDMEKQKRIQDLEGLLKKAEEELTRAKGEKASLESNVTEKRPNVAGQE